MANAISDEPKTNAVADAHKIMDSGATSFCDVQIKEGGCTCCTFTAGNWISLAHGEMELLMKTGTVQKWVRKNTGIICERNPVGCENKPLDCKLYPFFPYAVEEQVTHYVVHIGAGDEKCSAKDTLKSTLKGKVISKSTLLPFGHHLYRVGLAAVALLKWEGARDWMASTYEGYTGYDAGYTVIIMKD